MVSNILFFGTGVRSDFDWFYFCRTCSREARRIASVSQQLRPGRLRPAPPAAYAFAMGVRTVPISYHGQHPDLGSKALLLALGAVAGSVLAVDAGVMLFRHSAEGGGRDSMHHRCRIGIMCRRFISSNCSPSSNQRRWFLATPLFVGLIRPHRKSGSRDQASPRRSCPFLDNGWLYWRSLLINVLLGPILWKQRRCPATGWYSPGVLILKPTTCPWSFGFPCNVFREIIAIVLIPIVAARLGHLPAVAPGGATTMDVTLPIISKHTSAQVTLIAFYSGVTLTLLVPVILPLILRWAALV